MSLIKELLLDECQKLADETGIDVQRLIYTLMFLSNQGESFEEFADRIRRRVQEGYL